MSAPVPEIQMSLGEHLEELRTRLLLCVLAFLITMVLCFLDQQFYMDLVLYPHRLAMRALHLKPVLRVLRYEEAFFCYLRVAMIAALIITAPFILWQVWGFISSGLYAHERRYVMRFLPLTIGAFIAGVLFGFWVLVPLGLKFLASYGSPTVIEVGFTLSHYLSLFFLLTFVCGLIFELPLFMYVLNRVNIFRAQDYLRQWRYAVLTAFVLGAFFTPPDVFTQLLMAGPLIGLYFCGVGLCYWAEKQTRKAQSIKVAQAANSTQNVKRNQFGSTHQAASTVEDDTLPPNSQFAHPWPNRPSPPASTWSPPALRQPGPDMFPSTGESAGHEENQRKFALPRPVGPQHATEGEWPTVNDTTLPSAVTHTPDVTTSPSAVAHTPDVTTSSPPTAETTRASGAVPNHETTTIPFPDRSSPATGDWNSFEEATRSLVPNPEDWPATLVARLGQALGSGNLSTRNYVLEILQQCGVQATPAIPGLIKALGDSDGQISHRAAAMLRQMDPANTVGLLVAALTENDSRLRAAIMDLLQQYGRAGIRALRTLLLSAPQDQARASIAALGELGAMAREAVPELLQCWQREPALTREVIVTLGRIGPTAAACVPALAAYWEQADTEQRVLLAHCLGRIGGASSLAILLQWWDPQAPSRLCQTIIKALQRLNCQQSLPVLQQAWQLDPTTRRIAARAALSLASAARQLLREELQMPGSPGCLKAVQVCGWMGPAAAELLPLLFPLARAADLSLRQRAVWSIGQIAQDSAAVLSILQECQQDEAPKVRVQAVRALVCIAKRHGKTCYEQVLLNLEDRSARVRCQTVRLLVRTKVTSTIQAGLARALSDPDEHVREYAYQALSSGLLLPPCAELLCPLVVALDSYQEHIARLATRLLRQITLDEHHRTCRPHLCAAVTQARQPQSRAYAAQCLGQIGQDDPATIAALIRGLEDPVASVRQAAAQALGMIGTAEHQVLEALSRTVTDPDHQVQCSSAWALHTIMQTC